MGMNEESWILLAIRSLKLPHNLHGSYLKIEILHPVTLYALSLYQVLFKFFDRNNLILVYPEVTVDFQTRSSTLLKNPCTLSRL
jgi:hypothetical protein